MKVGTPDEIKGAMVLSIARLNARLNQYADQMYVRDKGRDISIEDLRQENRDLAVAHMKVWMTERFVKITHAAHVLHLKAYEKAKAAIDR